MKFTAKQKEAQGMLAGSATHLMLFGGSRSGKTFLHVRNIVTRAMLAPGSRHAVLRFRFSHVKNSVVLDTFPKVVKLCFPSLPSADAMLNKTDWYAQLPNGSQIWFGGLDDKERTEKILGQEYATIFLNECSQIAKSSVDIAVTRLAQHVEKVGLGGGRAGEALVPRMYYDCNPPSKSHWSYKQFILKIDTETRKPLPRPEDYDSLQMNPIDNSENLTKNYLETLGGVSARLRKRFLDGKFADATPNQLFDEDDIGKFRVLDGELPDFVRVGIGVDPSGADDVDNADNDATGIFVAALGADGNAYVLEDLTVKASPGVWGRVVAEAYDRHEADFVVGEQNYGGAMVKYTIQVANPRIPYKKVHASRGKAVRAEPIAALYENGKVRHVGQFVELEDELSAFSTAGYLGEESPNRADALIWILTSLFAGLVKEEREVEEEVEPRYIDEGAGGLAWMG